MALIAKGSDTFEQAPEGTHQAVCYNVYDCGYQKQSYKGEEKVSHRIILAFEIEERLKEGPYSGDRMTIFKEYTLSLNEKATLRKHLEGWRGKAFTEKELEGFDIEVLIGKNCLINIIHNENGRAKVNGVSALPKGMKPLTAENDQSFTPNWIQKKQAEKVNPDGSPFGELIDNFRPGPIEPDEPGF